MVILSNAVNDFIIKLENDAHFKNVKIIRAYPYMVKPTRLAKTVLCVSLGEVESESASIGDGYMYGTYTIDIDIYAPFDKGSAIISEIVANIINALNYSLPVEISTTPITSNGAALCYTARCSLKFNDLLNTGGADNE